VLFYVARSLSGPLSLPIVPLSYRLVQVKIIFLNCWGATNKEPLAAFIREQKRGTDVFCFQEAYGDMQTLASELLGDYTGMSAHKTIVRGSKDDSMDSAVYVRQGIDVISSGTLLEDGRLDTGLGLYARLRTPAGELYVCNVHGVTLRVDGFDDKLDKPSRLEQSQAFIDFFKDKSQPIIVGGDFNMLPEAKSLHMFEEAGYRNLITDYGITSTRNRFIWERYPDTPQKFADYVFVRGDVNVQDFRVPDIEISDHLPQLLECSLELARRPRDSEVLVSDVE